MVSVRADTPLTQSADFQCLTRFFGAPLCATISAWSNGPAKIGTLGQMRWPQHMTSEVEGDRIGDLFGGRDRQFHRVLRATHPQFRRDRRRPTEQAGYFE